MSSYLLNDSVVKKLLDAINSIDHGFRLDGKESVALKVKIGEYKKLLNIGIEPGGEGQFISDLYKLAALVEEYVGNNPKSYNAEERAQLILNAKNLQSFCFLLMKSEKDGDEAGYKLKRLLIQVEDIEDRANQWRAKYDELVSRIDNSMTAFMKEQQQVANKRIEEALLSIEKDRAQVAEETSHLSALISKMTSLQLSEEFMNNALAERTSANLFRRVSLWIMAGIGSLSVLLFLILELDLPTAQHTMARLAMALFLTFIVAYTARQSALHRAQEHSYMRKAMDLNAITPYLASMPADSQNTIKGQLAQKLFAPAEVQNGCDSASFGLLEVVTKLTEKIPAPKG